jgi:hypothetical protein
MQASSHAASDRYSSMVCIGFYKCCCLTLHSPTSLPVMQYGLATSQVVCDACLYASVPTYFIVCYRQQLTILSHVYFGTAEING